LPRSGFVQQANHVRAHWAPDSQIATRFVRGILAALYIMKRVIFAMLALVPTVCISAESECSAGNHCSLRGVIRIFRTPPVFTSMLDFGNTCVPLALADSVYRNYEKWDEKTVLVEGAAYSHAVGDLTLYYVLKGRNVTGALCQSSRIVLFVKNLKLAK
jgi:hypothetical protein